MHLIPRPHMRRHAANRVPAGAAGMAAGLPSSFYAVADAGPELPEILPLDLDARGSNELRPAYLADMIGQDTLRPLLRRIIDVAISSGRPLDHLLMQGASGTGKTTLAQIVAHELGVRVFQVKAPVDLLTFEALRLCMADCEVLVIDEIHQQVSGDRRGLTQAADPETFFHVMEDRTLATATGMLPFPAITIIGATTDAGLLPEPFLNRFPLQPRLAPYTEADMTRIVAANAAALGVHLEHEVDRILAAATRGIPRIANNYVKNARTLAIGGVVTGELAEEVIVSLNATTLDGLTLDMQRMLRFLLRSRRESRDRTVVYQASVNTIATALGKSRDTKAISLYVEPYLIERGYVQVTHGGRMLTPKGIERASRLEVR